MTFTLGVSPYEVVCLSFVVNLNLGIYFADLLRELMMKLRNIQKDKEVKFCITIDNAKIH